VIGLDLLGAEGHHEQHVHRPGGVPLTTLLPVGEQLEGQIVGPLAVVEKHHGRAPGGTQRFGQRHQRRHAARLRELLGAERDAGRHVQDRAQAREVGADRAGPIADAGADRGAERGLGGHRRRDLADHAGEHLKRRLRRLVESLASQDPAAVLGAAPRQLGQEPALAPARLRLEQHERAASLASLLERGRERVELLPATDEGRLRQRAAPVTRAGHEPRLAHTALERGGDLVEVGERGRRRLVAVARILSEQALDDVVEHGRYVTPETAELGRRRGEVQAQELAHAVGLEGRAAGQAFEEQRAGGVEIRPRVDAALERAGLLGRHVAQRAGRQRACRLIEVRAPGEAEVDQERAAEPAPIVDDDIGGLHVAVQHAVLVHVLKRGQDVPADDERVGHCKRAGLETLGQREALHERCDQIELAGVTPGVDQRREPGARDLSKDERFVREPLANARGDLSECGRLDDDAPAGLDVVGEPRVDAQTRLQLARRPESPRECEAAVLPVCH
jgi:hypothetical protein